MLDFAGGGGGGDRRVAVVGRRESPTRKIKSTRSISRVVAVVGAEGSPHSRNQADKLDFVGGGGGRGVSPTPEIEPTHSITRVLGMAGGQKGVTNPDERARFREVVVAEGSRVVYGTLAV